MVKVKLSDMRVIKSLYIELFFSEEICVHFTI